MSTPMLIPGESPEVLGLDAAGTMRMLLEERRRQDEAAARELRAVTHWADLHRTDHVGAAHPEAHAALAGCPVLGLEGELRLAGEGAFVVEEFAVAEIAAALRMSETAARAYVGQALELRDRLPRCWRRVMAGELPAWKARRIAEETLPLNAAAAAYVDGHLAPFAAKMSLPRILRVVHAAISRHDPEVARERAEAAADRRGVWVVDDLDGTSTVTAVTSTPDAADFDRAVARVAAELASLGDQAREQVRRAKAVGVLADPQQALDLAAAAAEGGDAAASAAPPSSSRAAFHVHLHTAAIEEAESARGVGVARVQRFGPRSLAAVQQWLADVSPGAIILVTPVVDLAEHISVDSYEVPDRLRRQVEERDLGCRFPWCGREGRFDLDHIDPYVSPDDGGSPGQTTGDNLARLCRFHHRVKTRGRWRYHRDPGGSLTWISPLGHRYTVDEHGTLPRS